MSRASGSSSSSSATKEAFFVDAREVKMETTPLAEGAYGKVSVPLCLFIFCIEAPHVLFSVCGYE